MTLPCSNYNSVHPCIPNHFLDPIPACLVPTAVVGLSGSLFPPIELNEEVEAEVGNNEGLLTSLEVDVEEEGAREDRRVEVEGKEGGGIETVDFLGAAAGGLESIERVVVEVEEGFEASILSARVEVVVFANPTPVVDRLLVIPAPTSAFTVNLVPTELLLFNPTAPPVSVLNPKVSSSLTFLSDLILSNLARVDSFLSPGVFGASGIVGREGGGMKEERDLIGRVVEDDGAGVERVGLG